MSALLPIADRLQSNAAEAAASCDRMAGSLAELVAINERQQRDFERIFGKAARS